jgi:hypothetical protein
MLKEIEERVRALAGTALGPTAVGMGVGVALRELAAGEAFQREQQAIVDSPLSRRRVLPIAFELDVTFPATPRASLLEDVARVAHALADPDVRTGKSFLHDDGVDRGYEVVSFALAKATVGEPDDDGAAVGEMRYRGLASIWPPESKGRVFHPIAVDITVVPLPSPLRADPPRVAPAGTSEIVVPPFTTWVEKNGARPNVSVRVLSDLPPDDRGKVTFESPADLAKNGFVVHYIAPRVVPPTGELMEIVTIQAGGVLLASASVWVTPAEGSR